MSSSTPRQSLGAILWKVALAGYGIALLIGTHLPPTLPLLPSDGFDKLEHFTAYAGLAWLLTMAWESSTGRLNGRHLWFAWLAIIAFAAIDEVTQMFVHRDADVFDWLADAAGAAVGIGVFLLVRRLFARL
jgi:VanZ family protein